METPGHINQLVEHLFRHESGRLVTVLTHVFGLHNMELAEDVVQETMMDALNIWPYKGVPDNPQGWLFAVARNKAINLLKREKLTGNHSAVLSALYSTRNEEEFFSEQEIADSQLRMMFACCHPSISPDSQVALILKTLCGFSIPEIAQAFITSAENINKRLVRARKDIRHSEIQLEIPASSELKPRLSAVVEAIYLLFNEGYHASQGDKVIRHDLCIEAIRLARLLEQNKVGKVHDVYALLALMFFNASRFDARLDESGAISLLNLQDRTLWDKGMIALGYYYMENASVSEHLSLYYILAAISAQHCSAESYSDTNWQQIVVLYDYLLELQNSPVNQLNRVVALVEAGRISEALSEIKRLSANVQLNNYYPLYAVRAEILMKNEKWQEAIADLSTAINLCSNNSVKELLISKLGMVKENV